MKSVALIRLIFCFLLKPNNILSLRLLAGCSSSSCRITRSSHVQFFELFMGPNMLENPQVSSPPSSNSPHDDLLALTAASKSIPSPTSMKKFFIETHGKNFISILNILLSRALSHSLSLFLSLSLSLHIPY